MSAFFTEAWTSGIVGSTMKAMSVTAVFAGSSATGDFTGDGHQDVLISMCEDARPYGVVRNGPTPGRLLLLKGNGDGTFTNGSALLTGRGDFDATVRRFRVGDFNGDGVADFAAATNNEDGRTIQDPLDIASEQVAFLSNGGKLVRDNLGLRTWGHSLDAGDWNNDGRDDIVVGGFTNHPGENFSTAVFVQDGNGNLSRVFLPERGGLAEAIADLEGDSISEVVDYWTDWSVEERPRGLRTTLIKADGSLGASTFQPEDIVRIQPGITWNGDWTDFVIRRDDQGKLYVDVGLHDLKDADLNGDGADDVIGTRAGWRLHFDDEGNLNENGSKSKTFFEVYTKGAGGLNQLNSKFAGWMPPQFGLLDFRLIDWNGDGHLDIFAPSPEVAGQYAQILLNDGVANFSAIPRRELPVVTYQASAEPVDANGDGIMDIMLRLGGLDVEWMPEPPAISANLFLGAKRFYTGPGFANPALRGAPGFNEDYYLNQHPQIAVAVGKRAYRDGLEHYLKVGKARGWKAFAPNTIVFGSDKADKIRLREGNETAIGGKGRDTYFGGPGRDTFKFADEEDSGITPSTRDAILDFLPGTDRVDLSKIDGNGNKPGHKKLKFLTKRGAKFNRVAGEIRWLWEDRAGQTNDVTLLEGDTDADGTANFQIELKGLLTIKATDLVL